MKTWRNIFRFIISLLLLEICKRVTAGTGIPAFYFLGILIGCTQLFVAISFFFWVIGKRFFSGKPIFKKSKAYALVLMGLFFILAEYVTTLFLNNPSYIPKPLYSSYADYYDFFDSRLIQYEKDQMVYDSVLFYRFSPNNNFVFSNREFRNNYSINNKGLRDDEKSLKSPDIICLGDSYTMGWGVEQEESFAQQLEKKSGWLVLNAGVSSYGTARELKLLKLLDTSKLKYIVIQYCFNDYMENKMSVENHFELKTSSKKSFDSIQKSYRWTRYYFPGKNFLSLGPLFIKKCVNKFWPIFKLKTIRETPPEDIKEHASVFIDNLYHSDISFSKTNVIVILLDKYVHLANGFLDEAEQLSNSEPYKTKLGKALHFIRVGEVLNQQDFFLLDLHLKASGHKKIADLLWEKIRIY